jgi:threonine dehydrogenase-like Zn-dependent dehydrogenase
MTEASEGTMVQTTRSTGVCYARERVVIPIHVACLNCRFESRKHFHVIAETVDILHAGATASAPIPPSTAAC